MLQKPEPLVGEVYGPRDRVMVVGRPKPFNARGVALELPAGLTVEELVDKALEGERSGFRLDYAVYVDGTPIPVRWRDRVRVRAGHTVTFEPRLASGDVGRTLGLIGIAVAALVATILLGPGGAFAIGTIFGSTTLASLGVAAIGAGIVIGGTLAINALFPVAKPQEALTDQRKGDASVYGIGGAQNTADPFGPVPSILGTVRVFPRYAALPFTTFSGDNQFLRMIFGVGYGPLSLSNMQIGETPIDEFDSVSIEAFDGLPTDAAPTLYTNEAFEEALAVELTEAASWQTRRTATNVTSISLDISAPAGIFKVKLDSGEVSEYHIKVEAEYQLVGAGGWTTLGEVDKHLKKQKPLRWGLEVEVAEGQYDVRVRKASSDSNDDTIQVAEQLFWSTLRYFRSDPTVSFNKPLALVAIKIKATGQLNNIIESFNLVAQSRVTTAGGTLDVESSNPADLFRWVLQGPAIHQAVPDENIDLVALVAWRSYCVTQGWEYNREHDFRGSVFDTLQAIASAGRARVVRTDGKWGVIWDAASVPVAQHFTPRNSWAFEESRVYFTPPDALRVNFINAEKGWVPDELIVYSDGFDASNATVFEAMEFPGVTDQELCHRLARFQLAQMALRPSNYSLTTNWQAVSCTVGDRVYCAHDVTFWGLAQGRVRSVNGDTIVIDEEVTIEGGKEYSLRFRQADGTSVIRRVGTPPSLGDTFTLILGDVALPDPAVGDLVMFGETDPGPAVLLRVREIEWLPDLRARLSLVDDAPGIAAADTGPIPAYDSQITTPANWFIRAPSNPTVREAVKNVNGVTVSDVNFSWQQLNQDIVSGFETEMRNDNVTPTDFEPLEIVPSTQLFAIAPDVTPGAYSFRVRALFANGTYSAWTTLNLVSISGSLVPPADVANFRISILDDTATLTWDSAGKDVAYYALRFTPATAGVSWATSTVLFPQIFGTTIQAPALNGTYLLKAVRSSLAESVNPALIISSGAALNTLNTVVTAAPEPTWPGTKSGTQLDGSNLILSSSGSPLAVNPSGTYYFDTFDNVDLGEVFTSRVSATIVAFGEDLANTMSSWATLASVATLSGAESDDWSVSLEERHAFENLYVSAMLHFDGADAATSIVDETGKVWTAFGNAQLDTAAFKFGTASLLCDGTGDYALTPDHTDFTFGAGDFTVEAWFNRSGGNGTVRILAGQINNVGAAAASAWWIELTAANVLRGIVSNGSVLVQVVGTTAFTATGWHHVALVRTGNVLKLFVDGVQEGGNVAFTGSVQDSASNMAVGRGGDLSAVWWFGWIDDFRISKGIARYTANFTPQVSPLIHYEWSEWRELQISDITARYFEFRLTLYSFNAQVQTTVSQCDITIDMPDRVEALGDLSVGTGGLSVAFSAPFRHLETVLITAIQGAVSGDYALISNRTESGFDVIVKNAANVAIARTVDAVAVGYGRVIA